MRLLADTNILAELARPRPDAGVDRWSQDVSHLYVSAVTVEEISYGLAWKPNQRIADWFTSFLTTFVTVVPVDDAIARQAGKLRGRLQAGGKTRTQADMLIVATALDQGLTLVTRNERDFEGCGVRVLNPFLG